VPGHVFVLGGLPESLTNFRGPLLRELASRGWRISAAAAGPAPDVEQQLREWGIDYVPVPLERAGLNPVKDGATVWSLMRTFRRLKPDVFFGYTVKPVVYGTFAARAAGVPRRAAMLTGLGYAFTEGRESGLVGQVAKRLLKTALSFSDITIFHNPDDLAFMRSKGVVMPATPVGLVNGSGVDLEHYAPAPMPDGPPTFLLIARLLRDKGIGEYVAAARRVKATFPDAKFRLAGPIDPNPSAFKKEDVDAWVGDGTIEYLGPLADVRPALAACHVYVLPSYREGTPRTVLEAMAIGRPIITTDAPGCRQTVTEGENGFLVPVKDDQLLAGRMRFFIENRNAIDAFANRSRENVLQKFEAKAVARNTADFILGAQM
jgi:glycosyltransferase involved in cell wall biosynthesis